MKKDPEILTKAPALGELFRRFRPNSRLPEMFRLLRQTPRLGSFAGLNRTSAFSSDLTHPLPAEHCRRIAGIDWCTRNDSELGLGPNRSRDGLFIARHMTRN